MKTLRQLAHKYDVSDSLSERKELEEQIFSICSDHLSQKIKICDKYRVSEFENKLLGISLDSDYRINSGGFYDVYDVGDGYIMLSYSDSWSYGGNCDFSISFPYNEVDGFDLKKFEQAVIGYKRKELKYNVKHSEIIFNKAKTELEKFEKSLIKIKI